MSAFAVKFLGVGRIFARIFKIYNQLIYWYLREIKYKNMLFSMRLGCKTSINAPANATKQFFIPNGHNAYKYPLKWCIFGVFAAFFRILPFVLVQNTPRFGAYYTAFWCKIHCVLVQNARRFGAKCVAKSSD